MQFNESQRFNQWYIWLPILGLILFAFYSHWDEGPILENNKFWSLALPLILVVFLLGLIRLNTQIDRQGIHVQFFPFHLKPVLYEWKEIYTSEVVKYSPIGDYGGWGIRISLRGNGKAFSVKGSQGIKLVREDGKIRMIGTQLSEKAQKAIDQFHSNKET